MDEHDGQGSGEITGASGHRILAAVAYMAEQLLRPGPWTENLTSALERFGTSVGADRLHVLQCRRDDLGREGLTCIEDWIRPGAPIQRCTPGEICPWEVQGLTRWRSILGQGRTLDGPVADLPEPERTVIGRQGTLSVATVPVFVGDEWWGVIGIDDCRQPRVWSKAEMESLSTAARLIGNGVQRQRAEAAIRDGAALERAIIDLSPIGISVRDRTGRLMRCNAAWQRIWAMTDADVHDEMMRERDRLQLDERDSYLGPYTDDVVRVYSEGGSAYVPEVATRQERPGVAAWVSQRFFAIPDEHGGVSRVVTLTEDVSSRRRAEEHASDLVEQLQEAARDLEQRVEQRTAELRTANEELRAFTYSVSHDLRAPLRVLDGFSAALIEDFAADLPPEALRYAQRVRNSVREMGHLIERMLELSRLTRHKIERRTLRVNDIVAEAIDTLPNDLDPQRAQLVIGDLGECSADPLLLRHVFVNLISNALKFTRNRTTPLVEIGRDGDVYYVRDNGVGFPMELAGKLFRPFQRLHSAQEFEGTGVGLTIVSRIVMSHGGRVWADAREGEGACFRFTIGETQTDQYSANAP